MSDRTKIEWADATWNPVTGCEKISPGCLHCYAETFAERFRGVPGHPYEHGFDVQLRPERLTEPLHWKKPRRVFVCSMSDLFQIAVPQEFIDRVFDVMTRPACEHHTFIMLTKRAQRMAEAVTLNTLERAAAPPRNLWFGVSVENQRQAELRIPHLKHTAGAGVRFLSCEPLLEDLGRLDLSGLDWVLVGGESGGGARPCNMNWIRSIVEQCDAAGVPVFVKQLGANCVGDFGLILASRGDPVFDYRRQRWALKSGKGCDIDEFPIDLQRREFPVTDGATP